MLGVLHDRRGQVGAGVEQVVLNLPQHLENLLTGVAKCDGSADGGIGFVAVGVGRQSRIVLGNPAEVAQSGGPVVTGPGVDASQVYSHGANGTGRRGRGF